MAKRKRDAGLSDASATRSTTVPPATSNMTTRSMIRNAAVTTMFMTAELLENVLWFLPMKDLLLSQRVCRKWQGVIEDTPRLQQSLFMRPRKADFSWVYSEPDDNTQSITQVATDQVMTGKHDIAVYPSAELNPLVFAQSGNLPDHNTVCPGAEEGPEIFRFRGRAPWMDHPQGSWRKMFGSQPPLEEFWYHWCFGEDLDCDDVLQDRPVTLADFEKLFANPEQIDEDEYYEYFTSHFFSTPNLLFPAPSERKTWRIIECDEKRFIQLAESAAETPSARPQRV